MTMVRTFNQYFYHLIASMLLAFVMLLVMYVYFLNTTVHHVAKVESIKRTLGSLTSNVASLEQTYLKKKQDLTLEYAHELGFVNDKEPLYIHTGSYVAVAIPSNRP